MPGQVLQAPLSRETPMESELKSRALIRVLSHHESGSRDGARGWEPQSVPRVGFGPRRTAQIWGWAGGFGSRAGSRVGHLI